MLFFVLILKSQQLIKRCLLLAECARILRLRCTCYLNEALTVYRRNWCPSSFGGIMRRIMDSEVCQASDFHGMKYAQIRDDSRLNLFHRLFLFTVNKLTLIIGNHYENRETMRIVCVCV